MSTDLAPLPTAQALTVPAVFAGPAAAERRFWEFFATQLSNDHTRKAYLNAVRRFAEWCQLMGIRELAHVEPMHVAAFLKVLEKEGRSAPTIKQHLAALRMLFDWLVVGQVIPVNPAHAVRGPKYSVRKGKTPVLAAEEARALLDSIETDRLVGLRDRALIGLMVYTFARVNAALSMKRRGLLRPGAPRLGAAPRKGRQAAHAALPPQPRSVPRSLHRRRRHHRGLQGAAVPHRGQPLGARADHQPDVAAGRLPDDPAPGREKPASRPRSATTASGPPASRRT